MKSSSAKNGDVLAWADAKAEFFVELDGPVQAAVTAMLAAFQDLVDIRSGRSGTDPFVIALAGVAEADETAYSRCMCKSGRPLHQHA